MIFNSENLNPAAFSPQNNFHPGPNPKQKNRNFRTRLDWASLTLNPNLEVYFLRFG